MSYRLSGAEKGSGRERVLVATVPVAVYDRGASVAAGERFEAELASYPVVCEAGGSPWEAVRRLVLEHRALLERRWSTGISGS